MADGNGKPRRHYELDERPRTEDDHEDVRRRRDPEENAAMGESFAQGHGLQLLIGEDVVVDVKHAHLYIGTLERVSADTILLRDADVHFCGDSQTTTELYLVETKKNGIRPNRSAVYIMRSEVLSLSRLSDIIEY